MINEKYLKAVDKSWDSIWSNGITNPITVMEIMGTILMVRSQGESHWDDLKSAVSSGDGLRVAQIIREVRRSHGIAGGSEIESYQYWTSVHPIQEAVFELESVLSGEGDVLGDVFEHVLSKLATAGQFGQFRTPHHIVEFMVEIACPRNGELVLDPACGTGGFLIAADRFRGLNGEEGPVEGYEIDRTVARIAQANMTFHGLASSEVNIVDGLAFDSLRRPEVILANPPFAGTLNPDVARRIGLRTNRSELLFTASMIRRLAPGGRAAVIVPSGVLTGTGTAARELRETLVEDNYLEAVIELPANVFLPYTGVKTGILVWRNEVPNSRATKMIRVQNDGYSLDSKRSPLGFSDLQDALKGFSGADFDDSVSVTGNDLRGSGYSLSPSRYLPVSRGRQEIAASIDADVELEKLSCQLQSVIERVTRMKDML